MLISLRGLPPRQRQQVEPWWSKKSKTVKTYNTGDSPVVTDLSTDPAVGSLSKGERTGSRVLYRLWSYVVVESIIGVNMWCVVDCSGPVLAVPGPKSKDSGKQREPGDGGLK